MRTFLAASAALLLTALHAPAGDGGGWTEISVEDLDAAIRSGDANVYDNNPKFIWEKRRVTGAQWLNAMKFTAKDLPEDKKAMLVFYCMNENWHTCHKAADRAVGFGYTNVRVFGAGLEGWEKAGKPSAAPKDEKKEEGVLAFTMKGIDGKDVKLSDYKGKVVVLVNVASKCGLTKQYKDLEELYGKYKEKGLVVIGVPANEFGGQEPGTDEEIKEFCTKQYSVTFPMLSKAVVKGDGICPLYKFLTEEKTNPGFSGEITWNFTKFVVSREGKVVKRVEPKVKVSDEEVVKVIEGELEKK